MPAEPATVSCVSATLRMATRAVSRLYDEALRPSGLRVTQYSILARLRVDGPATVTWLSERLAMDRTTLARELAPLRRRGLVRISVGGDRRRRVVELTDEGRALLRSARPAWERAQATIAQRLGESRTETLLAELRNVTQAARTRY